MQWARHRSRLERWTSAAFEGLPLRRRWRLSFKQRRQGGGIQPPEGFKPARRPGALGGRVRAAATAPASCQVVDGWQSSRGQDIRIVEAPHWRSAAALPSGTADAGKTHLSHACVCVSPRHLRSERLGARVRADHAATGAGAVIPCLRWQQCIIAHGFQQSGEWLQGQFLVVPRCRPRGRI